MKRRNFISLVGGSVVWPLAARAQQVQATKRIGVLMSVAGDDPEVPANIAAFKHELQKLGWSEGRNVRFDIRFASANPELMRAHAAELVSLAPDAILTASSQATSILRQQTNTIPIVFASAGDALASGLIVSQAHPGGNVTGFTTYEISIGGKLLGLLKEVAPHLTRAALLYNPGGPASLEVLRTIEDLAPSLGVKTFPIPGRDPAGIERDVNEFASAAGGGLLVTSGPGPVSNRNQIVALAARHRLPAIYMARYFVAGGGLLSYGAVQVDQYRRAAGYVDRILRGEKPADLPVQAPTKYELVINLKTTKALGLELPATVLARADEVIE
jgi:putative ABC transport system substrate-binding protein